MRYTDHMIHHLAPHESEPVVTYDTPSGTHEQAGEELASRVSRYPKSAQYTRFIEGNNICCTRQYILIYVLSFVTRAPLVEHSPSLSTTSAEMPPSSARTCNTDNLGLKKGSVWVEPD
jgi:hypothetical protein